MMEESATRIRKWAFSEYIVYVDESGNTDVRNVDEKYPVFVLTFCIVSKYAYRRYIVSAIQDLKFEFFGHDMVNLHAYDIRQKENDFTFLLDEKIRSDFLNRLNGIMEESAYVLVCSVIRKDAYARDRTRRTNSRDIYHMAMQFCMERLHNFLKTKNQDGRLTHVIAEGRGKKEDRMLREEFRQILENKYDYRQRHRRSYGETPMEIKFASKEANSTGLQMADLIGHPVGMHVAFPQRGNRAFETLEGKLFRRGRKQIGLKIFP